MACTLWWSHPAGARTETVVDDASVTVSQPVVPVAEAWYRPLSPLCTLPVGCPPVELPAGYPDGTLHVGVAGGAPDSTTYIALPLPASGLAGGSLRLPVGPVEDGTVSPETAKVKACAVIGNVKDKVAGDTGTRPGFDCSSSSPAVPVSGGTVLTVDLAPFLAEWQDQPVGALALVPADTPATTDVWHLAFSRHDRPASATASAALPLSASLLVSLAEPGPEVTDGADDGTGDNGTDEVPSAPQVAGPPAIGTGSLPDVGSAPPAVAGPSIASPPAVIGGTHTLRPVASFVRDTSFAYPGIFLLPPLVLLAAGWAGRAFTRDLAEPQR
jgi:hypothetical protein